jgi:hypothetical protein
MLNPTLTFKTVSTIRASHILVEKQSQALDIMKNSRKLSKKHRR